MYDQTYFWVFGKMKFKNFVYLNYQGVSTLRGETLFLKFVLSTYGLIGHEGTKRGKVVSMKA